MRALVLASLLLASPALAVDLTGDIDDESTAPLLVELLSAKDGALIDVLIDSPGGEVSAGTVLLEQIRVAHRRVVKLRCVVDGRAASMAAIIFEQCDERLMHPGSYLLFHGAATQVRGNAPDLQRTVQALVELNHRLSIQASARLTISLAEYEAKIADADWVLSYEEALKVGAVDLVVP